MYIEVTKETFFTLFNETNYYNTEEHETNEQRYYRNLLINQRGVIVKNYVSITSQYYLTDINA